jgi:hypothetical protein
MRKIDKINNIVKTNLLTEKRYLESKDLLSESLTPNRYETDISRIKQMENNVGTFDAWDNKKGFGVIYAKPSEKASKFGYSVLTYLIDFTWCKITTYYGDFLSDNKHIVKEFVFSNTRGLNTTVTDEENKMFRDKLNILFKKAIN